MGKAIGITLKSIQTIFYALAFCCAGIILGFYGYFLAVEADRDRTIPQQHKAITGLSGAAVLYTILAVLFTCCLGGITIFAFLAIVLDVLFTGAFIALAILLRSGSNSCSTQFVNSPLGYGERTVSPQFRGDGSNSDSNIGFNENENLTYQVSYGTACRYQQVCFAVSIIGAFLFAIAALVQLFIGRNHKKEKRYGPSPANGYTAGSGGRKFWQRRTGPKTTHQARDAEMATGGGLAAPTHDVRPSHETGFTGSTVAGGPNTYDSAKPVNGAGGYHTSPAVNY